MNGREGRLWSRYAAVIGALTVALAPASAALATGYRVSFQTTLSGPVALPVSCQKYHDELYPQLATYAGAPRELTVVYSEDGEEAKAAATSTDAGRTWTRAPISQATACAGGPAERAGNINPLVSGGSPGHVYFGESWSGSSGINTVQDVELLASSDAGATWSDQGNPPGHNSQDMAVVAEPSQPGVVHAAWLDFTFPPNPLGALPVIGKLVAAASHDSGRTFSPPVTVFAPLPYETVFNSRLYRSDDGSLVALFETIQIANAAAFIALSATNPHQDVVPLQLTSYVTRSTDGGLTWQSPVRIGRHEYVDYGGYTPGPIDAAIGPHGLAAAVWSAAPSGGQGAIDVTTSSDGGRSWRAPSTAIRALGNAFDPAVAIAPNGDLGLFWYDLTDDTPGGDTLADAWFATSSDGGRTWSKKRLAGPISLEASFDSANTYDDDSVLGFYQDVAAVGKGFGVSYTVGSPLATDGRTDVRFARVVAVP